MPHPIYWSNIVAEEGLKFPSGNFFSSAGSDAFQESIKVYVAAVKAVFDTADGFDADALVTGCFNLEHEAKELPMPPSLFIAGACAGGLFSAASEWDAELLEGLTRRAIVESRTPDFDEEEADEAEVEEAEVDEAAELLRKQKMFAVLYVRACYYGDQKAAYAFACLLSKKSMVPPAMQPFFSQSKQGVALIERLCDVGDLSAIFLRIDAMMGRPRYHGIREDRHGAIKALLALREERSEESEVVAQCSAKLGEMYQQLANQFPKSDGRRYDYFLKAQQALRGLMTSGACFIRGHNWQHRLVSLSDKRGAVVDSEYGQRAAYEFDAAIRAGDDRVAVLRSYHGKGELVLRGEHPGISKNPVKAMEFFIAGKSYLSIAHLYELGADSYPPKPEQNIKKDIPTAISWYVTAYSSPVPRVLATVVDSPSKGTGLFSGASASGAGSNIHSLAKSSATVKEADKVTHLSLYEGASEKVAADEALSREVRNSNVVLTAKFRHGMRLLSKHETYEEGARLVHCAASNGLVSAMYQLACVEYERGKSESAVAWLNEATKHGHPHAHFMLYQFYSGERENDYLPVNEALALKHIKAAARASKFTFICVSQRELRENRQREHKSQLAAAGVSTLEGDLADEALKSPCL